MLPKIAFMAKRTNQQYLPPASTMVNRNARMGLVLFFIYLAFYAGFVLLAAFSPRTMAHAPLAGVNLAIWYGFALIAAALVLALIYGAFCRNDQQSDAIASGVPTGDADPPAPSP
jgi:uncharacterized membrane protein (DUF485 family)